MALRRSVTSEATLKARARLPYTLYVYYRGHGLALDAMVEEAVGRSNAGSGFAFGNGERNLEFAFAKRPQAIAAGRRALKALRKEKGTGGRATLYVYARNGGSPLHIKLLRKISPALKRKVVAP